MRWVHAGLGLGIACAVGLPAAAAPQGSGVDEVGLLSEASRLEADGDLASAERLLAEVLELRPGSGPALLALERVLRQQNRLGELPDLARRGVSEDPRSALLNQLLLRTYSALDLATELEAASEAWMTASPDLEAPYREVARTWEARGDFQRARATLERGRRQLDSDDALALELGSLYAALGEFDRAAAEWDRTIGTDGHGVSQVRRALRGLSDGGAAIIPGLVGRLEDDPTTAPRLAAAVTLATAAGLEPAAVRVAERLAPMLPADERRSFLIDLGRRADGARLGHVARWAYGQLVADGRGGDVPAIRSRFAELSRELGDTAAPAALPASDARLEDHATGPRQAMALNIEVVAATDPDEARSALRRFREEHRDAPETDRLAAIVAEAVLAGGDPHGAEQVLLGVRGPRTGLLRGRLALARGDRDRARSAFLAAAPGLGGTEATRVLSLVALLGRVSDDTGILLAGAMNTAAAGEPGAGIDALLQGAARIDGGERAALLEFAASLADAHGLEQDARALRRMLVDDHPRADEAPAALLALARSLGHDEQEEARELLERLVVEYPRSALVPQARRELDRIGRAGGTRNSNHNAGR